jgi:hypothetical protein
VDQLQKQPEQSVLDLNKIDKNGFIEGFEQQVPASHHFKYANGTEIFLSPIQASSETVKLR